MEHIRANGKLVLQIHIQGWASVATDGYNALQELRYEVTQAEWIRILHEGGYSKSLLFEAIQPNSAALLCGPTIESAAQCYRIGTMKTAFPTAD